MDTFKHRWIYIILIPGIQSFIVRDSVIFDKISEIHTSRSVWKLTLVENLDNYTPELETVENQLIKLYDELCKLHSKIEQGNKTNWTEDYRRLLQDSMSLRTYFSELYNEYQDLQKLTAGETINKRKRSLLPFVGSITSFLFGTTSEADLEAVKRNIRILNGNQKQLTHVVNESLSMLNITRKEMGENRNKLNEVIRTLKTLNWEVKQQQLKSNTNLLEMENIVRIYLHSKVALDRAQTNVAMVGRQLQILQLQFNMLAIGKLSPAIIEPKTLEKLLLDIRSKLVTPFRLYKEPRKNLWHFYKTLKLHTVIHDNKLLIIIKIPLINSNSKFELYQIHNLPFPSPQVLSSGSTIAKYDLESFGFAINYGRTEYVMLSSSQFAICASPTDSFCEVNEVKFRTGAKLHCEISLFLNNKETINKNCRIQIFPRTNLPLSIYLNNGIWATATSISFGMTISCENTQSRSIEIRRPLTIIHLNNSCFATSDYFSIPSREMFTSKVDINLYTPHLEKLNLNTVKLWDAIIHSIGNTTSIKIPETLASLESFPIQRLVSELDTMKEITPDRVQSTAWYSYVIPICVSLIGMIGGLIWLKRRSSQPEKAENTIEIKISEPTDPLVINGADKASNVLNLA